MRRRTQAEILSRVHKLLITYGTTWQSIDTPTRAFDSERAVVAICAVAIFDAAVRTPCLEIDPISGTVYGDVPMQVSEVLHDDGGYAISTSVCQNNRSLETAARTMELTQPHFCAARDAALAYLRAVRQGCR